MNIITETERLVLSTFTIEEAPLILELNLDPEVTRYTHDPVNDLEHAGEILEKIILPQYSLYRLGRWKVSLKSSGEFMGWCGLKFRPELDETDLGFRFMKKFWGRGYAREAAMASIRYGFEKLQLQKITGRAEPENKASWKVLEHCGMNFIGLQEVDGYIVKTYEIAHQDGKEIKN